MRFCRSLFVIISIPVLLSCSNRQMSACLNDIESYIEERPDSALTVLESIPGECLNSDKLKARYSLLYAMALDKNYIDTTDLEIIQPAVDFYSRKGSCSLKMKTFFYQGCIYANRGEDSRAMHYYLLALEDSVKVSDNHLKELVNSAISDIFSRNYNAQQELRYTTDALRYGKLAKDSLGIWAITGHLASCYANCRNWPEAKKTYDLFFSMPVYDTLRYFRRQISYAKDLLILSPEPDPDSSIEIIERAARTYPSSMTVEAYCVYAYAHQMIGNSTIANGILNQLEGVNSQQDKIRLWRYRIYRKQGRHKQAIKDLEYSLMAQDSVVLSVLDQPYICLQRDFLQTKADVLRKENELDKQKMAFIILLSLFITGMLFLFYSRKKLAYNRRIEELAALHQESRQMLDLQYMRANVVSSQLAEKDVALLQLRKQFATINKSRYKVLNDLCVAYLSPIKKERKDVIYEEAMRQLDIIVNDTETQNKFMSMVNSSLDNIIDKLRSDIPNHKEQDFRFLTYIIAGFDAKTISNLTGYSVGTIYTKKNRLKKEISGLESQYRDFYLEFFC